MHNVFSGLRRDIFVALMPFFRIGFWNTVCNPCGKKTFHNKGVTNG